MRTALPIPVTWYPCITSARRWNGLVSHYGWRRAASDGDTPADIGLSECIIEQKCAHKRKALCKIFQRSFQAPTLLVIDAMNIITMDSARATLDKKFKGNFRIKRLN
jgi:hypothetical protein